MPINCSLCKTGADFLFQVNDVNRKSSDETFSYYRCSRCKLIFLAPIPENLAKYYDDYHQFPTLEKLAQVAAGERFKIEMVQRFKTKGKLLEIGPSIGVFSYQAKQEGFDVDTIEMSRDCCEFLSQEIGVNAVNSDDPAVAIKSTKAHDVIALWHNIEHLPDPWSCLDQIAKNLKPEGILVIATPNPDSFGFRILGPKWLHVDAPRHLNLIPVEVLKNFLKPLGLEPLLTTSNDKGAKYWNRVTWQTFLMKYVCKKDKSVFQKPRWVWLFWAILGYILSLPLALIERNNLNGSTYTVIFRKEP
jgi:2-polyprenyl-3-methyl-5-hydroxy-6-metoxy-1,4-benzoquinol methylase